MALKIYWTKRALNNFDKILKYLEKEFGESTTKSFAKKVHEFSDILQDFQELGTMQNEEQQIRGFVIVKQVTIFYRIYDDHIRILHLFDNRQNPNRNKK